jgi:tricarballylate dehydrogenase
VTFAFGGLKISRKGEVEDLYGRIIPGLYAAGEMVGGLFFHNYASGTGLMSGATFGRLAGRSAAEFARPPASRAGSAPVRHDAEGAAP